MRMIYFLLTVSCIVNILVSVIPSGWVPLGIVFIPCPVFLGIPSHLLGML